MSWSGVKAGDWIRVTHLDNDVEISGTVTEMGPGWVVVGTMNLNSALWDVQEVRKAYKVGDIGLLKVDGRHYIGVYAADGSFYMQGTKMFKDTYEGIKILGNVNDE